MKKVLYLHGWSSDGSMKTAFMRSLGYDVLTPRLSDWFFSRAVAQAQVAFDEFQPNVVVGSSRGGSVAMNMDSGDRPLILLAPAWRRWGKARSVKKNCVVIHSPHDDFVPFEDSVELCGNPAYFVSSHRHQDRQRQARQVPSDAGKEQGRTLFHAICSAIDRAWVNPRGGGPISWSSAGP
jgi:hypothetical protein